MNLFTNMAALLARGVKLTITVSQADGENIEVGILPTSESGATPVALVPRSFVATPAEFDAEFPEIIAGYCAANVSLKDQLAAVQVLTDQAGREASEKAVQTATAPKRKATAAPAAAASAGKTKPEPELLGGGGDLDEEQEEETGSGSDTDATSSTPQSGAATGSSASALQLEL